MTRRRILPLVLVAPLLLGSCSLRARAALESGSGSGSVAVAAPLVPRTPSADVVAFCGPSTGHRWWREQLAALAEIGVTAVHGYCYTPPATYSVLEPGSRYASQAEQLLLAGEAQRLGLGVIPYDPTFWLDPAAARAAWAPFIADGTLVAVDLGDEPGWSDMAELRRRSDIVRSQSGVEPQVIFLNGRLQDMSQQHHALPTVCPTSDDYESIPGAFADAHVLRAEAGCAGVAIDTTGRDLDGDGDRWSIPQLTRALDEGFRVTLFTGVRPENFPGWDSLVDDRGRITAAGRAVQGVIGRG